MCLLRMTVVGEIPSAHSWWWLGSGSRGFWQGLDQVFVEQPQRRQVPGGTNCLEDKLPEGWFVFVCAMMHFAGVCRASLGGYTCSMQGSAMNVHCDECSKGPVVKAHSSSGLQSNISIAKSITSYRQSFYSIARTRSGAVRCLKLHSLFCASMYNEQEDQMFVILRPQ
jgi:hypothetical protein